jgi:hypothetical protein
MDLRDVSGGILAARTMAGLQLAPPGREGSRVDEQL